MKRSMFSVGNWRGRSFQSFGAVTENVQAKQEFIITGRYWEIKLAAWDAELLDTKEWGHVSTHNILKLILHTLEAQTLRVSGRKPRASRRPQSWWKEVESCTRLKGFGLKVPSLLTVVIHAFTSITVLLSFICQQTCKDRQDTGSEHQMYFH